jgi:hypothetical protein
LWDFFFAVAFGFAAGLGLDFDALATTLDAGFAVFFAGFSVFFAD